MPDSRCVKMCIRDRFNTDDYIFDVEKKDSIKTLLLTLWKSEDDKVTKTESCLLYTSRCV